ncbi:MAG TPA: helicase-associated domain-containing protein, partial [Arthrobacter sp.]|nr:helicase-associated domain-containing protein [Arthrobacter sp.]
LDFLGLHSATAIPQPLKYLIEDTASRHARLRVGSAATFIQSDDETALLELLNTPGASTLGLVRIAPTVLVSRAAPRETAQVLRHLGLSPAMEETDAGGVRLRRTTAVAGSSRPVYSAPRTAPPEADVDAQLAVLRSERTSGSSNGQAAALPGSEEATQLGLETLQKAIRLKQRVVINVVDGLGNAVRETVVPVAVNGGRVRVFDPAKETERVLSIHRIIDVEAAEELLQ